LVREREIIDLKQASSMQLPSTVADQTNVIREEINESDEQLTGGGQDLNLEVKHQSVYVPTRLPPL